MNKDLEIGTCVTFVDKYRRTLKGKVATMGEHLPDELKAAGCITVTAKPFSTLGDDRDVSSVVARSGISVITEDQFNELPWVGSSTPLPQFGHSHG